jgi:hypothetical protein
MLKDNTLGDESFRVMSGKFECKSLIMETGREKIIRLCGYSHRMLPTLTSEIQIKGLIRSAEAQYAISSSLRFVKQKQVYNLKNL